MARVQNDDVDLLLARVREYARGGVRQDSSCAERVELSNKQLGWCAHRREFWLDWKPCWLPDDVKDPAMCMLGAN